MSFRPTQPLQPSTSTSTSAHQPAKSPFFQQRDALVNDIAIELESVLQAINKLNRSLEGVIAVGNEFGNVEGLWSQFEGVMAAEPVKGEGAGVGGGDGEDEEEEEKHGQEEGEGEGEGEQRR